MAYQNISDTALRNAAVKVRNAMLEALPENPEGEFSQEFLNNIQLLRERDARKRRHTAALRRAVAAILAIIIGIAYFIGTNAKARAAVVEWFKETFLDKVVYWFTEDSETMLTYSPQWIPEGYELVYDECTETCRMMVYQDSTDPLSGFTFYYLQADEDTPLNLFTYGDTYTVQQISMANMTGEIYISQNEDEPHVLVWFDAKKQIAFSITSNLNPSDILKIAENIEGEKS